MSLYGCQLWDYSNKSVLASVFVTWRKCVRNIFSIPYNTFCNLVHLIAQDSSVRVKLHKRYLKFFNNASKSINTLVSMRSQLVINGSGSAACRSVNFICSTYDLNKYDISLSLLSKLKDNDEECAIQRASTIVDFLHYYDTCPKQSVREIVNYLCTFFFLVRLVLYMYMFYTRLWIKNDIIIIIQLYNIIQFPNLVKSLPRTNYLD